MLSPSNAQPRQGWLSSKFADIWTYFTAPDLPQDNSTLEDVPLTQVHTEPHSVQEDCEAVSPPADVQMTTASLKTLPPRRNWASQLHHANETTYLTAGPAHTTKPLLIAEKQKRSSVAGKSRTSPAKGKPGPSTEVASASMASTSKASAEMVASTSKASTEMVASTSKASAERVASTSKASAERVASAERLGTGRRKKEFVPKQSTRKAAVRRAFTSELLEPLQQPRRGARFVPMVETGTPLDNAAEDDASNLSRFVVYMLLGVSLLGVSTGAFSSALRSDGHSSSVISEEHGSELNSGNWTATSGNGTAMSGNGTRAAYLKQYQEFEYLAGRLTCMGVEKVCRPASNYPLDISDADWTRVAEGFYTMNDAGHPLLRDSGIFTAMVEDANRVSSGDKEKWVQRLRANMKFYSAALKDSRRPVDFNHERLAPNQRSFRIAKTAFGFRTLILRVACIEAAPKTCTSTDVYREFVTYSLTWRQLAQRLLVLSRRAAQGGPAFNLTLLHHGDVGKIYNEAKLKFPINKTNSDSDQDNKWTEFVAKALKESYQDHTLSWEAAVNKSYQDLLPTDASWLNAAVPDTIAEKMNKFIRHRQQSRPQIPTTNIDEHVDMRSRLDWWYITSAQLQNDAWQKK